MHGSYITQIARLLYLGAVAAACGLMGCAKPPPTTPPPTSPLTATPDMSAYVRFEIYAQSAGPSEKPLSGQLRFVREGARLDVFLSDGTEAGRLNLQPETCRDDPKPDCTRRFIANGRIQALGANLSCAVAIRNDVNFGYRSQALSGLCQSQFGRSYTLQLFAG